MNFYVQRSEVAFESTMIKALKIARFLKLYHVIGTNLGYNFANNMYIYGSTVEKTVNQITYFYIREKVDAISVLAYQYFDDYYKTSNGFH